MAEELNFARIQQKGRRFPMKAPALLLREPIFLPLTTGRQMGQLLLAISSNARAAAPIVSAINSSECSVERNAASNWLQGR